MFLKGKVYLVSSGNRTTVPLFVAFSLIIYLPRGCRTKKETRVDFFWHVTFTDVKIFISFPRLTFVYREVHVHIYRHTYTDTHIQTHIWLLTDCIWITAATKWYCRWNVFIQIGSGAMCWLDIYHVGGGLAVTWRMCDIGQNILQSSIPTGSSSSHSYFHMLFLIAFLQVEFVRD
jgi:hypothetical protein